MQVFLHGRLQKLQSMQSAGAALLATMAEQGAVDAANVDRHLAAASAQLAQLQLQDGATLMQELRVKLALARRGTDPQTLSRLTGQRRELESRVAAQALVQSSEWLRGVAERSRQLLDEAQGRLQVILLHALQLGLHAQVPLRLDEPDQAALERFWRSMLREASLMAAARQVALSCSQPDVLLLLSRALRDLATHQSEPR